MGDMATPAGAALQRLRRRAEIRRQAGRPSGRPGETSLPDWYGMRGNEYYCGLIARQIRQRALMRGQTDAARAEALAIADMIETGDFDWMV